MICETHGDDCLLCKLIDRLPEGPHAAPGTYYLSGLLHGMLESRLAITFCPPHHGTWAKFLSNWKREVKSLPGVQ